MVFCPNHQFLLMNREETPINKVTKIYAEIDTERWNGQVQIQNNIASVNSSRNQKIIKGKLDKSLEKLSSGFRINRAGDDAAG